jgi:predicted transcriptional regulator
VIKIRQNLQIFVDSEKTTTRQMKKAQILETIQSMPDEFSVDELIERLMILHKIEEGQRQVQAGKVYTEEEAKKKLDKWLK